METGIWEEIKLKLQYKIQEIFCNYKTGDLSEKEKRKIVFEYLCKNISYDYELLDDIKSFHENQKVISRNPYFELANVINNSVGICNAISQYYKLLLEELGIVAYCVICDDGTSVKHQLNLVFDSTKKTYSFDDITSVIVGRGTMEEFFDYGLNFANSVNQGNKVIAGKYRWVVLPEEYICYIVGKSKPGFQTLRELPHEEISRK